MMRLLRGLVFAGILLAPVTAPAVPRDRIPSEWYAKFGLAPPTTVRMEEVPGDAPAAAARAREAGAYDPDYADLPPEATMPIGVETGDDDPRRLETADDPPRVDRAAERRRREREREARAARAAARREEKAARGPAAPPLFVGPPAPPAAPSTVTPAGSRPVPAARNVSGEMAPEAITRRGCWPIRRAWTHEELDRYAAFVGRVYERKRGGTSRQRAAKLDDILSDPEMNLFLSDWAGETKEKVTPRDLGSFLAMTHCGSFPKLLYVYYSYMRGLPCTVSFVSGKGGDIRYSRGNRAVAWIDSYSFGGSFRSFLQAGFVSGRYNNFTTGNYRTAPDLEETDTVPIAIDPRFLKPGCIAYNAGGHALLVARVTPEGEVYFLDAHPDGSISSCKDLSAVPRVSSIDHPQSCHEGFRAMRLAVTKTDSLGRVVGVRPMTNEEMRAFGYSAEQYEAAKAIREKLPVLGHAKVSSYSEYVRTALRTSREKEKPFAYLREAAERVAGMFETRREFVDAAWTDVTANGPITLPDESSAGNIYQADGRWELWSSPSSDVDRKAAVVYVGERLEGMMNAFRENRDALDLEGREGSVRTPADLARAMLDAYREEFSKHAVEYSMSTGARERLTLLQICDRLWDLSFDPNHAPEIRWGNDPAAISGYRKVSTPFNSGRVLGPAESYKAERGLRFLLERQDEPTRLSSTDLPRSPIKERPAERLARIVAECGPGGPAGAGEHDVASR